MMKLLALGGCGGMGRYSVEAALRDDVWDAIVIADLDEARAEAFAGECADARVSARGLDVSDAPALKGALASSDVVLNGVGPYFRFGVPVLRAAIETGTHYVDFSDDGAPTLEMLALDGDAREAGVTALIGLGASPGLSNLLAAVAVRQLDETEVLHTIWGFGESPLRNDLGELKPGSGGSYGAAIEHWVEQLTGSIRYVEGGAVVSGKPLQPVALPYPGGDPVTCYTVGHPEPLTLVRSFEGLTGALNLMDMPRGFIRWLRRETARVDEGVVDVAGAAERIVANIGRMASWPMFSGVVLGILWDAILRRRHLPDICAYAEGRSDGRRFRIGVGLRAKPGGGMGGLTGVPAGIGLGMLARGEISGRGALPPELALDPDAFFGAYLTHCKQSAGPAYEVVREEAE